MEQESSNINGDKHYFAIINDTLQSAGRFESVDHATDKLSGTGYSMLMSELMATRLLSSINRLMNNNNDDEKLLKSYFLLDDDTVVTFLFSGVAPAAGISLLKDFKDDQASYDDVNAWLATQDLEGYNWDSVASGQDLNDYHSFLESKEGLNMTGSEATAKFAKQEAISDAVVVYNQVGDKLTRVHELLGKAQDLFGSLPNSVQMGVDEFLEGGHGLFNTVSRFEEILRPEPGSRLLLGELESMRKEESNEKDGHEEIINALVATKSYEALQLIFLDRGLNLAYITEKAIIQNDRELASIVLNSYPDGFEVWGIQAAAYGSADVLSLLIEKSAINEFEAAKVSLTNSHMSEATGDDLNRKTLEVLENAGVTIADYAEELVNDLKELGLDTQADLIADFVSGNSPK